MIVLVTGAASSGKSLLAERACVALGGDLVYLATMQPFGQEGLTRVQKHRSQRAGKGFSTVECYGWLSDCDDAHAFDGATVLLECLGNLSANVLFGAQPHDNALQDIREMEGRMVQDLRRLAERSAHLVIVGNEVGADGVSYDRDTRRYQELLGAVAGQVSRFAHVVVESVAGQPVVLKGRGRLGEQADPAARALGFLDAGAVS